MQRPSPCARRRHSIACETRSPEARICALLLQQQQQVDARDIHDLDTAAPPGRGAACCGCCRTNDGATRNLRGEAVARGINPERLVFAPRMKPADHPARHRAADLFLDTLPYGAHTTASDALWTGPSVLTCQGTTFAGRVGASLLTADGLSELIVDTLDDYEAMALKLARDRHALNGLSEKLARNRDTWALFDTARFTRHFQAAPTTMRDRQREGKAPQHFAIDATPS
jgi:protein O-GlcNAc transferase